MVPDPDPNAFAVGRDPAHAAIAVTRGLLETLDRDELQGVVAHEMSHVRNLDIRAMTLVTALFGAAALLSDVARRGMYHSGGRGRGGSRRSGEGGGGGMAILFLLWLLVAVLAPFITRLLALAVSRSREYLADASSVELTRNPLGLAAALRKIGAAHHPTQLIAQGSAHLCITDPRGLARERARGGGRRVVRHPPPAGKAHRHPRGHGRRRRPAGSPGPETARFAIADCGPPAAPRPPGRAVPTRPARLRSHPARAPGP